MLKNIDLNQIKGLSTKEVGERQEKYGLNELPSSKKRTYLHILLEVIKEPMFLLLIACGSIYLFLGDTTEAIMLIGFVFVIIGITFYQENKTEKALDALKDLSAPRALVIRNNAQIRIAGREVVTDDIVILQDGDRVPADAIVISCSNLKVDESLLTGESVSVRKTAAENIKEIGTPGGDDSPFVYSGTLVVSGHGVAMIRRIGGDTEMGKIGKSLKEVKEEKTNLEKETDNIVSKFAIFGIILSAVFVILYGLLRGKWIEGLLSGITLAMSILPEEFPVVLTIFLALGAWRMSKNNVLTRRTHAIQALGSATVLCVDKTGTLTQNKMNVKTLYTKGHFIEVIHAKELPEDYHELIEYGMLASQKEPFDPIDKALNELCIKTLHNTEHIHNEGEIVQEYPFSRELLAISHVWKLPHSKFKYVAAKGAPESIFELCHLSEKARKEINKKLEEMSDNGLRVLGVAKSIMTADKLPDDQHGFDFEFEGLIGFEDPIKPTVKAAIKECYSAGIRVVMITGDYPGTAKNIAKQIGFSEGRVITGSELSAMSEKEIKEKITQVNIFARVIPEQKLKIVNALKANGEIVVMTGDGVNDAPALKSSHIGIAMGKRGTDVAREASSVVLLDDDFTSIVYGVKTGRRIFDNIRKAMVYILAVHIPIAGITLLTLLMKWPLILLPMHIVFLELIIDPACSTVFEAEKAEENIMKRPPRKTKERIFSRKTVLLSVVQGFVVLFTMALVFRMALYFKQPEDVARAMAFTTLIISNLCIILTNRSWTNSIFATLRNPNRAFWYLIIGASILLLVVLYIPAIASLFKFGYLHIHDFMIAVTAGIVSTIWVEVLKVFNKSALA